MKLMDKFFTIECDLDNQVYRIIQNSTDEMLVLTQEEYLRLVTTFRILRDD